MDKQPAVSILLPFAGNCPRFQLALDSLLHQTLSHWELLLIDNGGGPNATELARRAARSDARIRILHEPQPGIAHALNHGLSYVRAPLIARMDADDTCHPDRLLLQKQYLDRHSACGLVTCKVKIAADPAAPKGLPPESSNPTSGGMQAFVAWQNSLDTPEAIAGNRFIESPVVHPSVMFRTRLIERYGPYSQEPVPEDYELWLRWLAGGVGFARLPGQLFTWYDHSQRLTRTHPNYSKKAFAKVKRRYLQPWIDQMQTKKRMIVGCGTSSTALMAATDFEGKDQVFDIFTDIKNRKNSVPWVDPYSLSPDRHACLILLSQPAARAAALHFLEKKGYVLGKTVWCIA